MKAAPTNTSFRCTDGAGFNRCSCQETLQVVGQGHRPLFESQEANPSPWRATPRSALVAAALEERQLEKCLAVSDFYHLPRIKLCFRRQGIEVLTVPAQETVPPPAAQLGREVLALWLYYFLPLAQR